MVRCGQSNGVTAFDRAASRPDIVVLGYPVISMTAPWTHRGSQTESARRQTRFRTGRRLSGEHAVTRTRHRRSSSRPTKTPPCRRRTASTTFSRCGRRACRQRCTSSKRDRTASGWRNDKPVAGPLVAATRQLAARPRGDQMSGPGPMMNRRQAIAALASTMTLPLISRCTREQAPAYPKQSRPRRSHCSARSRKISSGSHRRGATSLGIDIGARAALRSQLADRSAQGQQRIAGQVRAGLEAGQRLRHVRALLRDTHQHRGRSERLCDVARRIRPPVRRRRSRRLAQHALCRDSERRRVPRYPAVSRQRPSDRERR